MMTVIHRLLAASALLQPALAAVAECSAPYTDCTEGLQAALNTCDPRVDVHPLPALKPWPVLPLLVTCSHQKIVLHDQTVIEAKRWAYNASGATLLTLDAVSNVSIVGYGATLRMHRADYNNPKWYKCAQGRHGIALRGARHVSIAGLTVTETGGDGIYVSISYHWPSGVPWSKGITVNDAMLVRNYRQGMSVIAVEGLVVTNTVLGETGSDGMGHPPMAGIDFEPNDETQPLSGVRFHNVTARSNAGRGFQWSLTRNTPKTPPLDILFEDCSVVGGGSYGISFSGSGHGGVPTGGNFQLTNVHVSLTNGSGLLIENKDGGPTMALKNVTIDRVARQGGAPIWIEGQTKLCTGASFESVQLLDDVDRVPVNLMGNVTNMRGEIDVFNPALSTEHCTFTHPPPPGLNISCNDLSTRRESHRSQRQRESERT